MFLIFLSLLKLNFGPIINIDNFFNQYIHLVPLHV